MTVDLEAGVILATGRSYETHGVYLVAEADGPVRFAMIPPYGGGCYFGSKGLAEGKHLISVHGDNALGPVSHYEGAIGGAISLAHPPVLMSDDEIENPFDDGWACSGNWLARVRWPFVMTVHPWDMSREIFVTSAATDPEGLDISQLVMVGDALFWTSANVYRSGLNVWDPVGGTRPFIRWVGDPARGAGNLGTDGVDLVWSLGEGKTGGEMVFPTRAIMTAPFTTDPEELASTQRRLRSQPDEPIQVNEWHVGCGYAARQSSGTVMVVRLSDGWAWVVPNTETQKLWTPIGITCEEVFAFGEVGRKLTIARVRLDSLGAGLAPD